MHLGFILHELKRKGIHISSVLIVLIYAFGGKELTLNILLIILIIFILFENFRLKYRIKVPFFGELLRDFEKKSLAGHLYFLLGAIISISLFSFEIAIASILMASFGDATAAIFGMLFGKNKISNTAKSYEGTFAGLFMNVLIAFFIFGYHYVVLFMAITASLTELWFTELDDNLAIPVLSGFVAHTVIYIM
ncbi:diacylglycerol/polyprenol kinase family protein [Methanosalsum natronophilum]|uniref:CTP--2, 3-di-O-geranylgeranyl-sn-glycero-1-phosphate cytidyltransferase n=1 Tax=Methanosalsum natronophilum TaxID=768733 RepID=A0A3R7XGK7_9EURY|nr:CTP--2,3-di-O-geranylgeranyl-sn-glycero-1-phosphate cytidyltransferase [Methanosalsum natronophilum]MCS3924609.1 dolichol kinase [Methanosalsum natronophilum]RQD82555.1 MAG: CTP--2,3-di-O-geranylgeranyl-sn-glycero-1-phosphate cytidyltransferase [Methanosalsum natronophilum]